MDLGAGGVVYGYSWHTEPAPVDDAEQLRLVGERIRAGTISKVLVLTGAGISVSAGVDDFRTPGTGLFSHIRRMYPDVSDPTELLHIDRFRNRPEDFFATISKLPKATLEDAELQPTAAHLLVRALHDRGALLRHYTQNVDLLERRAGIPEGALVEAHGTFASARCTRCHRRVELVGPDADRSVSASMGAGEVPFCAAPRCVANRERMREMYAWCAPGAAHRPPTASLMKMGIMKPDCVLCALRDSPNGPPSPAGTAANTLPLCLIDGEDLPERFYDLWEEDARAADCVLVMGTSLAVHPICDIVEKVGDAVPRILINRELVGGWTAVPRPPTHIALLGDCDDGTMQLAYAAGVSDRVRQLKEEVAAAVAAARCAPGAATGGAGGAAAADPDSAVEHTIATVSLGDGSETSSVADDKPETPLSEGTAWRALLAPPDGVEE